MIVEQLTYKDQTFDVTYSAGRFSVILPGNKKFSQSTLESLKQYALEILTLEDVEQHAKWQAGIIGLFEWDDDYEGHVAYEENKIAVYDGHLWLHRKYSQTHHNYVPYNLGSFDGTLPTEFDSPTLILATINSFPSTPRTVKIQVFPLAFKAALQDIVDFTSLIADFGKDFIEHTPIRNLEKFTAVANLLKQAHAILKG